MTAKTKIRLPEKRWLLADALLDAEGEAVFRGIFLTASYHTRQLNAQYESSVRGAAACFILNTKYDLVRRSQTTNPLAGVYRVRGALHSDFGFGVPDESPRQNRETVCFYISG